MFIFAILLFITLQIYRNIFCEKENAEIISAIKQCLTFRSLAVFDSLIIERKLRKVICYLFSLRFGAVDAA